MRGGSPHQDGKPQQSRSRKAASKEVGAPDEGRRMPVVTAFQTPILRRQPEPDHQRLRIGIAPHERPE